MSIQVSKETAEQTLETSEFDLSLVPIEDLTAELVKRMSSCVVCGCIEDSENLRSFVRSSGNRYIALGLVEFAKSQIINGMHEEACSGQLEQQLGNAVREIAESLTNGNQA